LNFDEAIKNEKIRNVMGPSALLVPQGTPYGEVIGRLQAEKKFCAVILAGKKVVGIFTERDALKKGLLQGTEVNVPIEKLMTPNPVVVDPEDSVALAIRLMDEGKYRHLPIVDRNDEYVGLISVRDIVDYLSENYPYEVFNQPPDPHKFSIVPEGA